jgi:hypothetical protein
MPFLPVAGRVALPWPGTQAKDIAAAKALAANLVE